MNVITSHPHFCTERVTWQAWIKVRNKVGVRYRVRIRDNITGRVRDRTGLGFNTGEGSILAACAVSVKASLYIAIYKTKL